nr:unnamed protein product [Digitaria exilis]
MANHEERHHFLLVVYGLQSHINPGRVLAHRLTRLGVDGSVLVTLAVPVATYRSMFPSKQDGVGDVSMTTNGVVSYVPYSDGVDDGSMPMNADDRAHRRRASSKSLSAIIACLADRGQPATCIMCTMAFLPVIDVAREHNIPVTIYWIQPATLLAMNYHYFHGYSKLITLHANDPAHKVSLPWLGRPLQISNFPSYLIDMSGSEMIKNINESSQELFEYMDQWRPKVLANTFDELEANVLMKMKQHLDVFTIGPMVRSSMETQIHLFNHDTIAKKRYMEWLQAHLDKSVVYVSFGSMSKYTKHQMDEIVGGLTRCGRPYLLVLRRDGLEDDESHNLENMQSQGMVVDWCDQLEVLSHFAVGCFVSHCGWNSTVEALVAGVPIIGVPNVFDQSTNIYLIEEEWKVGVKAERNSDGVLTGTELARCIELIMGDGERAKVIRERAKVLKEIAKQAANTGGSADRNLRDFLRTIHVHDTFA